MNPARLRSKTAIGLFVAHASLVGVRISSTWR
jgi:hypothetical protein